MEAVQEVPDSGLDEVAVMGFPPKWIEESFLDERLHKYHAHLHACNYASYCGLQLGFGFTLCVRVLGWPKVTKNLTEYDGLVQVISIQSQPNFTPSSARAAWTVGLSRTALKSVVYLG